MTIYAAGPRTGEDSESESESEPHSHLARRGCHGLSRYSTMQAFSQ